MFFSSEQEQWEELSLIPVSALDSNSNGRWLMTPQESPADSIITAIAEGQPPCSKLGLRWPPRRTWSGGQGAYAPHGAGHNQLKYGSSTPLIIMIMIFTLTIMSICHYHMVIKYRGSFIQAQ